MKLHAGRERDTTHEEMDGIRAIMGLHARGL